MSISIPFLNLRLRSHFSQVVRVCVAQRLGHRMVAASRYVGVSQPRIRGKRVGWVAQKKSLGLYRARFASPHAAATWLAAQMKVPLEILRRSQ
jgi:hypothetical protein